MTVPAWLEGADDSERQELADLGLLPDLARPMDETMIAATAAKYLRALAITERDAQRLEERRAKEMLIIESAYAPQFARAKRQIERIRKILAELAQRFPYGKKKSVTLAYGTIGKRDYEGGKIEITDKDLCAKYIGATHPEYCKADIKGLNLDTLRRIDRAIRFAEDWAMQAAKPDSELGADFRKLEGVALENVAELTITQRHAQGWYESPDAGKGEIPHGATVTAERTEYYAKPADFIPNIDQISA